MGDLCLYPTHLTTPLCCCYMIDVRLQIGGLFLLSYQTYTYGIILSLDTTEAPNLSVSRQEKGKAPLPHWPLLKEPGAALLPLSLEITCPS